MGNIDTKKYDLFSPLGDEYYLNIVVSPDDQKVAFEVYGGNLHVMNLDGTGLKDLGKGHRPQWAPDSQHLVYMITSDDGHTIISSDLYTININGSDKKRLLNSDNKLEMNPSWSPDGIKIIYDVSDEGAIYSIEVSIEGFNKNNRQ